MHTGGWVWVIDTWRDDKNKKEGGCRPVWTSDRPTDVATGLGGHAL